jgi:hypothetical protein
LYLHWQADQLSLQVGVGKHEYAAALSTKGLEVDTKKEECLVGYRGRGSSNAATKLIPSWPHGEPKADMRLLGSMLQAVPPTANSTDVFTRIKAFTQAAGIFARFFAHPRISLRLKVPVFEATCTNTLMSGMEVRHLSPWELQRMEKSYMRVARRLLGRKGYGRLSKYHTIRGGVTDDFVRRELGIKSVRDMLTIRRLRWIRSLLLREARDGVGSAPLLAALLGTREVNERAPRRHPSRSAHTPRDEATGALTPQAPPLLHAIAKDLLRQPPPPHDARNRHRRRRPRWHLPGTRRRAGHRPRMRRGSIAALAGTQTVSRCFSPTAALSRST